MDFLPVFIKMIELFLILIIGYIAAKLNILGREAKANLSKLILNVTMPCTILSSVMTSDNIPTGSAIALLLAVSFTSYIILFVLAKIIGVLLSAKGPQRGVIEFGIMFANVGFIGYPVTQAVFGNDSLLYTTMFNLPFNLLCYSLGVSMIKSGEDSCFKGDDRGESFSLKKVMKLLITPAMISSIVALAMALTHVQGPEFLANTFTTIGGITTPGALLVIGSALSEMPVKEMFTNVKAYLFTIMSVIVTPLLMYMIYRPFTTSDPLLLGEATIISAMPVATAGTMLCVEYGGDEKFMAQITFLTTLVSVVSIPLIAMML